MKTRRKIGIVLAAFIASLAVISIFWTPYPVLETDSGRALLPPSPAHIAGTDALGRDIASRLMAGSRFTLTAALATVAIAASLGSLLGMTAGYRGGATDYVIMRITDAISAFPGILLALVVVSVMGGGRSAVIAALCVVFTPSYIRLSRIVASALRGREYIVRERALGAGTLFILLRHILPNTASTLLPAVIVGISNAILAECAMSFLGLGASPPAPSWGQMMSDAGQCILTSPYYAFFTGSVITISVAAFNCIGTADTAARTYTVQKAGKTGANNE